MTTTPTAPAPVRPDAGSEPSGPSTPPLLPLLAGGLLTGAGIGFMVDGLSGALLLAAGLIAAGAGMVLRATPVGRTAAGAVAAAVAVVLGAGAFAAAVTATSVSEVRAALPVEDTDRVGVVGVEESRTIAESVDAVTIDVRAGEVVVRETAVDRVQLTTTTSGDRARIADRVDGDRLVVDGECRGGWLSWVGDRCRVDVALEVPRGTDVTIDQGAGSVRVVGVTGSTRLETGAAEVRLDAIDGPLRVSTGAGAVIGRDLTTAETTLDTGAGDIDLAWTQRPDEIDISTGVGEIDVVVPRGAYRFDVDTGVGSARTEGITSDPTADARIDVYTGAGSATVRGR